VTGVDLHPEDLLEREGREGLLPAEKDHLERHLRQCTACRFERLARDDFQKESDASDEDIDVHRLLARVLVGGAAPAARVTRARYGGRPRQWLLAAGIATAAGTAGAAVSRFSGPNVLPPGQAIVDTRETAHPRPVRLRPISSSAPVSAVDARVSVPPPLPDLTPATGTMAEATSWQRNEAAVFSRANDARRLGDRAQAEALYRLLVERHGSTPEAHHSQALLGQMFLDSGDPSAALVFFDDYLRKGGALREDVTLDRATALQRLGRTDEEAEAWTALLRAYPESVHAERARKRLSELRKR
jgi:TolA-binding protein